MRALVTGGAGFIGAWLARALAERGAHVRLLDTKEPADPPPGADVVPGSVTDAKAAAQAVEERTHVFHLAALSMLWVRDRTAFDRVNVEGTRAILAAAARGGVTRVVHVSSLTTLVARNGPRPAAPLDERLELSPAALCGPYPASKRAGELVAQSAAADGLDVVLALPTLPTGPGDRGLTSPTRMIVDFANGRTPAYLDTVFNFVDVRDLAEGLIALIEGGRSGARYLLGGENLTMLETLAILAEATGRPVPSARVPHALAWLAGAVETGLVAPLSGQPPRSPLTGVRVAARRAQFSSARAAKELGWSPRPAAAALTDAVSWLREQEIIGPASARSRRR